MSAGLLLQVWLDSCEGEEKQLCCYLGRTVMYAFSFL
jgi:hypothetical protein